MANVPSEKTSDVTNDQTSNVKIDVTRGSTCDVTSDMTNNIKGGVKVT